MSVLVPSDEAKSSWETMSEEMQAATPAEQVTAEQVQSVENNGSEATAEQTQEVQQEQTQEQKDEAQKKEPWFQKRINEQTRKYYEAQREAQALKERLAQYERQQYPASEQQAQQVEQQDVLTIADRIAEQKLAERSFNEACNKVYETGAKELPNFDAAVSNLQLVGVTREFLEATTASDAGHKILHHLGQLDNLQEAERILRLPPVQMGRELAKLEIKLSQPQAKPVSKAPAPIKPVGTGGVNDSGLRDDLPIEEWMRRDRERKRAR